MHYLRFKTSSEAYKGIIEKFLTDDGSGFTHNRAGLRVWAYDVVIQVDRPDIDVDLSSVGFTPRRWQTFLSHYFEPEAFSTFYQRTINGRPAQETGYSCPVNAPHTMGNCLFGLSAHTKPLRVALHSRACVWAPTGLLDLSFASVLAYNLQRDLGAPSASITWSIGQLQVNSIKSLPILTELGYMDDIIAGEYNYSQFGKLIYYEYHKLHKTIESPYKTYRRYAKKMQLLREGIRPDPFTPFLPEDYRLAALRKLPGRVSIKDIAEETGMPMERVEWSARQMGLTFQNEMEIQFDLKDPRIQRLIANMKHRSGMRGVGG